ncbi:MAG TPA: amidohydrolase, partial [Gemmatimonadaceae bacterium]|nr:amidohydrolase [Gemmatimonadaceae bacterium]
MRLAVLSLALLAFVAPRVAAQNPRLRAPNTAPMLAGIDAASVRYADVARLIWQFAEVGYQEVKSSALLQSELKAAGFSVKDGIAGEPTAFVAEFGSGKPVIALLGEFDALPGLSQDSVPVRRPLRAGGAGHGCGHHLFGTASVASAIALKQWMQANGVKGTLRMIGAPAEEGGSGKVFMVRDGVFGDVDAVIVWHPGSDNVVDGSVSLANISGKFRFHGVAAHASGSPERGRSAL